MTTTETIEIGSSVIRNEPALRPIVGTVEDIAIPWGSRSRKAEVVWQNATRRFNGNTSTTSHIDVSKLLIASKENIEAVQAKARKVTPYMKSAMGLWREFVGVEEYVRWDDIRERLKLSWDQWWKGYERACQKLITLGYLEAHQDNRNCNTGNKRYRIVPQQD